MSRPQVKLAVITLVCFISLTVLMLFSGNHNAVALDSSQLFAVENSRVQVMPVNVQQEYVRERLVYGQLESGKLADIGFERSGAISELLVEEGAFVVAGQPLAKLNNERLLAQQKELQASLDRARADAKLSKLSQQRVKDLVTKKLEPKQRLDEANAQLDASNAVVAETQARLSSLDVEINKLVLTAPYDGQIIAQNLDSGAVVAVGQSVFRIIDNASLEARFGLPEDTAFMLQSAISFKLQLNGRDIKADLKTIERSRNRATRTLDAIFSIAPDNRDLSTAVTGDIISLTVELPYAKEGAWLPLSALSNGVRGMWSVLVLDAETSELSPRLVIAEHIEGQAVYVSGGLQHDDLVVVDGLQRFTPGQKVVNYTKLTPNDVFAKR